MARAVRATVDLSEFKDFAARLRKVRPELARQMRKEISDAAEDVAGEARQEASWSATIPTTIRTSTRGLNATISAQGLLAVGFETGKTPKGNRWRHPNRGNRKHWYGARPPMGTGAKATQGPRPFLVPALNAQQTNVVAHVAKALDRALRNSGVK